MKNCSVTLSTTLTFLLRNGHNLLAWSLHSNFNLKAGIRVFEFFGQFFGIWPYCTMWGSMRWISVPFIDFLFDFQTIRSTLDVTFLNLTMIHFGISWLSEEILNTSSMSSLANFAFARESMVLISVGRSSYEATERLAMIASLSHSVCSGGWCRPRGRIFKNSAQVRNPSSHWLELCKQTIVWGKNIFNSADIDSFEVREFSSTFTSLSDMTLNLARICERVGSVSDWAPDWERLWGDWEKSWVEWWKIWPNLFDLESGRVVKLSVLSRLFSFEFELARFLWTPLLAISANCSVCSFLTENKKWERRYPRSRSRNGNHCILWCVLYTGPCQYVTRLPAL